MKPPDYHRSRHSVSLLYAHLVFVTKYRRRVLTHAMLTDAENVLQQVCGELDAELVEFNGEPDHVHLLVRYPPRTADQRTRPTTKRRYRPQAPAGLHRTHQPSQDARPRHLWTPSYFAVSAGGAPLSIIKQYIANQARPL